MNAFSSAAAMVPIGLFGGTFDPVHFGHLRLAEDAAEALRLSVVRWIPVGSPPHRNPPHFDAAARLRFLQLALAENPRFVIDRGEIDSDEVSYSVHTLQRLRREVGETVPLLWIIGADAFAALHHWYCWQELFSLCHFAVALRPGCSLAAADLPPELLLHWENRLDEQGRFFHCSGGCIVPFASAQLDISSTDIRRRLAAGASVRYLLPDAVCAELEKIV